MTNVRVRFAPSPSGFLHIGGARTALFNWLFARHHGGKFFLRIEDTDRSRSTDEAIEAIFDGMRWLGLDWDKWEGGVGETVRQTERFEIYQEKIEDLLAQGKAYRCYCTAEELADRRKEAMKAKRVPRYDGRCRERTGSGSVLDLPFAIRFKASSEGKIIVKDMVKGEVVFDRSTVDDLIIARSDGSPTYNFCVVVDDAAMQITHVIRGDDHLNNTPRQIQLYEAFGYPIPHFAHVPMILGSDKARLSKRHGATAVQEYQEAGYLPEAMLNYLVRLGWSHKDQELFTLKELIEKYAVKDVGTAAAIFNPEKLLWVNAHYIKTSATDWLAGRLLPHLDRMGIERETIDSKDLNRIILALRERSRTLKEMAESAAYFFLDEITYDDKTKKFLKPENVSILKSVRNKITDISFEHDSLVEALNAVCKERQQKLAQVAQPVRAAVTGKVVSPGIFDVLEMLGPVKSLKRLDNQIERLTVRSS
ncbi:MAG: glutamate--tRNA ligase [Nitrospiria bacterium]